MNFLNAANEPLRVYIYGVAVAVLALLVGLGVIDAELSDAISVLVSAALLVGGVERARSKVSPVTATEESSE